MNLSLFAGALVFLAAFQLFSAASFGDDEERRDELDSLLDTLLIKLKAKEEVASEVYIFIYIHIYILTYIYYL